MRFSARKGRLVADLIRGKKVDEALTLLRFCKRAAAKNCAKLVRSAMANAQDHKKLDVDSLYVKEIYVDEGPSMKRIRPRARGRVDRVIKRTCHATVVLGERS